MKKFIWLFILLFIVKVKIPFGADLTYRHVQSVSLVAGTMWELILEDGRKAYVPGMWATIEEEKKEEDDK